MTSTILLAAAKTVQASPPPMAQWEVFLLMTLLMIVGLAVPLLLVCSVIHQETKPRQGYGGRNYVE